MSSSILSPLIHLCKLDLRSLQSPRRASSTPVTSPSLPLRPRAFPTHILRVREKPQSDRVTHSQVPVVQPSLVPGPSAVAYPPLRPRSITLSHWLCIRMVVIISRDYAMEPLLTLHFSCGELAVRLVTLPDFKAISEVLMHFKRAAVS